MVKPIYTRRGDKGQTDLFSGERIDKTSPRVETYGTVDELNASLGLAKAFSSIKIQKLIQDVQVILFYLASELASMDEKRVIKKILPEDISELEKSMDSLSQTMPEAYNFVIPGGMQSAAFLHVSRTVCRRAERAAIKLSKQETVNLEIIKYLNRLSDYLFVLSRYVNIMEGEGDVIISREGISLQKKDRK